VNPMLRQALHAISTAFGRLSPREQRLIGALGLVAAVAGLYVFAIEPTILGRARLERRIETLSSDLVEMQRLGARISRLESELGTKTPRKKTADSDFSLFSFMDKATTATVNPDAVAAMNPSRRQVREGLLENAVELRLSTVSLHEIVGLLRKIEQAGQSVYVKRVELKRRYDDHTRFDAVIVTGSVSKT
jgi:type II secretory pathway component PulM